MRFSDKRIIVTGSGRGIGRAIARRFAEEGAAVAICDIDRTTAEATAGEINESGGTALAVELDVRSIESVRAMLDAVVTEWGRVDVLVNNAGITIAKPVVEFTEEEWERTLDINLKGVFRCSQLVAVQMITQGGGKIINLSSESGKTAKPNFTIYAASKFGVVGFTQGLAQELAPHGITVNAVCPGIVHTPMWEELDRVLAKRMGKKEGEILATRKDQIPLGRLEQPEDVAGVVAFLASDDANYMTGQAVNVTGGREFH
ncbi:MAG: glucose 1-dehydrogenase [Spirochaetes bacterium]|jgi:acetoin reductase-like protein|nr:glucose 1-dehydrogenase [Spirochaetota bacterium]